MLSRRIELHLTLMKDLQISSTCIDKHNSPIALITSDVRVSEISDHIQDEMSEEYVPILLSAVPTAEVQQRSLKQESRFIQRENYLII